MVIGGILRERGFDVSISRSLKDTGEDILILSLSSTQHLLDEGIHNAIDTNRQRGGRCYVGGPVSAPPGDGAWRAIT